MKEDQNQSEKQSMSTVNQQDKQKSTSEELIKRSPIEGTPFTLIEMEDKCFATLGKYKITDNHEFAFEVIEDINTITWDKIIVVATAVAEIINTETYRLRNKELSESLTNNKK